MPLVFVYGTLKRGFPNHDIELFRHSYVADGVTVERYPLYIANRWYSPILIDEPGNGRHIHGELYNVDPKTLEMLDKLESTDKPNGYKRHLIDIEADDGSTCQAFTYFKTRDQIQTQHSEMLSEYPWDDRYVPASKR